MVHSLSDSPRGRDRNRRDSPADRMTEGGWIVPKLFMITVALVMVPALAGASWIDLGGTSGSGCETVLLEDGSSGTVVEYVIPGFFLRESRMGGTEVCSVHLPKAATFLEKGMPELPRMTRSILVPDGARMGFEILEAEYVSFDVPVVLPSKGNLSRDVDPLSVPYEFAPYYGSNEWFPEETFVLHDPYILRDFRGLPCRFHPFQYNPATGTLRVCRKLVVRVFPEGPGRVNVKPRVDDRVEPDFEPLYRNMFLNYDEFRDRNQLYVGEAGRMLIIVDDAWVDEIDPLARWKMKKGIETDVVPVSEVGSTRSQVQNYIQDCYDTDGVTYILLVGDENAVPPQLGTTGAASGRTADPVYACLDGSDWFPDAFVSRFCAQYANQVENMVARSVGYERFPSEGASWYHRAAGVASDDGSPPDWQRADWIRNDLLGYTYTLVDRIYDPGASDTEVTAALDEGRSAVFYIGHGWNQGWFTTGFNNTDVGNLQNAWMLPMISSVACEGGEFVGTTCFGEVWLRSGTAEAPTGALAFYGSSVSQSWVPPTVGQAAAFDYLVADEANTVGGLLFNGSCVMIEEYLPYDDGAEMFQTWQLFGDASVPLRTDTPASFTVAHAGSAEPGDVVSVTVSSSGSGLGGALVCLWMEGEYHEAGYTDSSGGISFTLPGGLPSGTMDVTVTAYNHIPYEGICEIERQSPPSHRTAARL